VSFLFLVAGALLIVGCSGAGSVTEGVKPATTSASAQGVVRGGQQPVTGATVQLYAAGTGGDGSAATPLLSPAVMTDGNGNFTITGLYKCPSASALVFLVATGGNPGLGGTVNNASLALMAALGPCGNLTGSTFIFMNELTSAAAVYSLAPYMASATAVGSGVSDQAGLASAFTLASELVNTTTGSAPGTGVPSGAVVPTAQLNLVADILAACVNSPGGTTGNGSSCGSLFMLTTAGSTAPTNTIAALLNLANDPTLNTTGLYALASPTGPFQPTPSVTPANLGVQLNAPSALYVDSSSLSFGTWTTGFSAPVQTIAVRNFTATPVSLVAAISGTGASSFGISQDNCGATLAPQGYCTYEVEFSASTVGTQNGFFVLSNSSANSLIEIPLSGVSVAANAGPVTLTESSLTYTVAGTTQDIVVENYGSIPLSISNVVFSNFGSNTIYSGNGSFSQTNNCGTSVAAQSVCTISVESTGIAWAPGNLPSTFTATMTILDNASAGPQVVSLSSTNTAQVSGGLSFTGSAVGVPVTGTLSISAEFRNATASGNYAIGGADPGDFSVNPSFCEAFGTGSCPVTVTFTPAATGVRSAQLLVNGASQYVPLTGTTPTAPTPGPAFVVSPSPFSASLTLPAAPDPNGSTGSGTLTITNSGTTSFGYAGILTGLNASAFTADGSGCASLAPQQSCSVTISMAGVSSVGAYSADLLIKDANSTLSQLVPITGLASYWAVFAFPNSGLQFGSQALGTTSPAQTFVLADGYGYPMGHPLSVALKSPSNFTLTQGSTCPASLSQTCTLAVAFSPYQSGIIYENLTVTDPTSGETNVLQLAGTGGSPTVSLSTSSVTFPPRSTGTTSIPTTVTLTNTGTLPLAVSGISVVGAVNNNFTETNTCTTVAANGTCSINVSFAPTATGVQSASIQIVSNAASSPNMVGLTGTGQ
jgi:hypothetical protein